MIKKKRERVSFLRNIPSRELIDYAKGRISIIEAKTGRKPTELIQTLERMEKEYYTYVKLRHRPILAKFLTESNTRFRSSRRSFIKKKKEMITSCTEDDIYRFFSQSPDSITLGKIKSRNNFKTPRR